MKAARLFLLAVFVPLVAASQGTSMKAATKIEEWKLNPNSIIHASVKNFKMTLESSGKKHVTTECPGKPTLKLNLSDKISFFPVCHPSYGGIVRLQTSPNPNPAQELVLANDFADEGCFETTTGELEVKSDGEILARTTVRRGGKMAEGTRADCRPGTSKELWTYIKDSQSFKKAIPSSDLFPTQGTPVMGVLKRIEQKGKPAEYVHEFLFRNTDGKWSGAQYGYVDEKVTNHASTNFPYDINMQMLFDGRQVGSILIKSNSCNIPSTKVPGAALKAIRKRKTLVTSSISKPTDPEIWKALQLKQALFPEQEIHTAWTNSELCQPRQAAPGEQSASETVSKTGSESASNKKPSLQVEKIYAPKNKTRYLVIAKKSSDCDHPGDNDYSSRVWLFRDSSGKWIVAEGNELIDIGDFNGDGKSEALFHGTFSPPADVYELRNMESFQSSISVDSHVGEGGGSCHNISG